MDNNIAIKVSNVSKKYTIGKQKDSSLRNSLAGVFKSSETKVDEFWALKDISFKINKGDVIGIIGKNGAGKSTLLKILSQITRPTEGRIEINGRVASLLEVGTGFHPELTGRENIFLNGTILGMTRKEVKAKFDEIVEFSGVEKFIDTAVKHYSSGMYVRLAFAVAAHLEPEILIIDEVLAVGDAEFQKKCLGKMKDVAGEGRTVIFVSHNMTAVNSLCSRGILIENGALKLEGTTSDIIQNYLSNFRNKESFDIDLVSECESISIKSLRISSSENNEKILISKSILIKLKISILKETQNLYNFNLFFTDGADLTLFVLSSEASHFVKGDFLIEFNIPENFLNDIHYNVDVMAVENKSKGILFKDNVLYFKADEPQRDGAWFGSYPGVIRPKFLKSEIIKLS